MRFDPSKMTKAELVRLQQLAAEGVKALEERERQEAERRARLDRKPDIKDPEVRARQRAACAKVADAVLDFGEPWSMTNGGKGWFMRDVCVRSSDGEECWVQVTVKLTKTLDPPKYHRAGWKHPN